MTAHLLTFAILALAGCIVWLMCDPDPAYSLRHLARENGVDLMGWWERVKAAFSTHEPGRFD